MLHINNNQPSEQLDLREDGSLDVINVFDTIQTEGPLAGLPAVFVRVAGCSLQCKACDTQYTEGRHQVTVNELVYQIQEAVPQTRRASAGNVVVITGGEPFRQNLEPLLKELLQINLEGGYANLSKLHIQIETNGAHWPEYLERESFLYRHIGSRITVVCSPKVTKFPSNLVDGRIVFKYVMEADHVGLDGLPSSILGTNVAPARPSWNVPPSQIYLQACDSQDPHKNYLSQQAVVKSCQQFGYRLSYQSHKALGLD